MELPADGYIFSTDNYVSKDISVATFSLTAGGPERTQQISGIDMPDILCPQHPFVRRKMGNVTSSITHGDRVLDSLTPSFRSKSVLDSKAKAGSSAEPQEKSYDFAKLPELVMVKIFNFLGFNEARKVGRVCKGWYESSRSFLPKDVEIVIKNSSDVPSLLMCLPACLKRLQLHCSDRFSPACFIIEFFFTLKNRCPKLESLSINHGRIFYDKSDFVARIKSVQNMYIENLGVLGSMKYEQERFFVELECFQLNMDLTQVCSNNAVSLSMTTLSLANAVLDTRFFSRVLHSDSPLKVLNLSYCNSYIDPDLFPSLPNLEELYLAGVPMTDEGIASILSKAVNLKKLDLEDKYLGHRTLSTIKKALLGLEELYLGSTIILCYSAKESLLSYLNGESLTTPKAVCIENSRMHASYYESLMKTIHFERLNGIPLLGRDNLMSDVQYCNHFHRLHAE